LKKNKLAAESELYIFKDGLKNNATETEISKDKKIIEYINQLNGFKKITFSLNDENLGLTKNIIKGLDKIFQNFDAAIILEDDLEFSEDFLEFMNEALNFYKEDKNVGSVSGYSFGYEKLKLKDQLIATNRHSSWGWGTWKDRWENIDWEIKDFENIRINKIIQQEFNKAGNDFFNMLRKNQEGRIQSWAIKWNYHNFKLNRYCIVPRFSKVNNTGTDSKGTNFSRKTEKFKVRLHNEKINFINNLKVSDEIISFNQNNFRIGKVDRFKNLFKL
jgi:hypothetical protein